MLIAASDRLFAEAARAYIGSMAGWQVVGMALDGVHALAALDRLRPSCALVIGDLPRLGTAALTSRIRQRSPDTTVVVLGYTDAPGGRVLEAGASAEAVLAALTDLPGVDRPKRSSMAEKGDIDKLRALTPRERTILRLLASGLTRDEVAATLSVSTHTVRTHMQNLYAKLGLHNRLELVRFAVRHGLVGRE